MPTLEEYRALYYNMITQKLLSIFQPLTSPATIASGDGKEDEQGKAEEEEQGKEDEQGAKTEEEPQEAVEAIELPECVICLVEIEDPAEVFTCTATCKKVIGHTQCVQHWLSRMKSSCPLCRGHIVAARASSSGSKRRRDEYEEANDSSVVAIDEQVSALFYLIED